MLRVKIIIPTRNSAESLDATINSIEESTTVPHEYLIWDSESEDNTQEVINKYKSKNIIINYTRQLAENSIIAMNNLFKQCIGPVLLTHDDVIFPKLYKRDWLQMMVLSGMESNTGIVTSLNGGGISGPEYLNGCRWVGTWCTYITPQAIEKIGYLDDKMTVGEDIDYSYRIVKAGLSIKAINYWVDHHRSGIKLQDHAMSDTDIVKQNGDYFKKKHGI